MDRSDQAGGGPASAPLEPPVVPADAYDDDYYRSTCAGAEEWSASGGAKVSGIYPGSLKHAGFRAGEVVVDIGTGRGELPVVAAKWGAKHAVGIEYSSAAVELARQTVARQDVGDRVEVLQADARSLPLPDGYADLVTMVDVVEHLAPPELHRALEEAHRILRPGGRIYIHTFPTRTMYDVTYRALRALARRRSWPVDPRNDYEHSMHVNEQSLSSMRRALRRAGFATVQVRPGRWVHVDHLPERWAQRLVRGLAAYRLTRPWGASDIHATAFRAG